MFTLEHIVLLIILFPLAVFLGILLAKKKINYRWIFLVCMIICVLSEIIRICSFIQKSETSDGYYIPQKTIPLHLCSIQIIFIFIMGLTKNVNLRQRLISFFIPTAMIGAFMAILIPTNLMIYGLWHVLNFQYLIYHTMLIVLSVVLYIREYKNLNIKSYNYCLGLLSTLMVGSVFVNSALQYGAANFFYTAEPPAPNLPLLNFDNGWHFYMFNLIWIGVTLITFCYLPIIIRELKLRKKKVIDCNK